MAVRLAEHKERVIGSLVEVEALKTSGDFSLKSKRSSPYFLNIGDVNSGTATKTLAESYASTIAAIVEPHKEEWNDIVIYGIPEKGVGFVAAVCAALVDKGINASWFFTRKIEKTYGEATDLPKAALAKSRIVGRIPTSSSQIIMLDDVLTTADTKYTTVKDLSELLDNPKIVALVIAADRQEVGIRGESALEEFTNTTGIPVYSALNATEIRRYLSTKPDYEQDGVRRMANYLRVYGTTDARGAVAADGLLGDGRVVLADRSLIPACDMSDLEAFEKLVRETAGIDGIGGYKIGFKLGLRYGLPAIVEAARRHTDKPLIYDHQKAGTDIPDTGKDFMEVNRRAGIDAVILFPHAGPETERAWIYRALNEELKVIVGGIMTHPGYLVSEGGFIQDSSALDIYRIAARAGIRDFVVPGTKPDAIELVRNAVQDEGIVPIFYAPGFGAQLGNFADVKSVLGSNWHAIVGRAIVNAPDGEYGKAAEENVAQLLRS